jgi:hypothetical protein
MMMKQRMHIPAEEFVYMFIPQSAKAGWVAEGTAAIEISSIDSLGGRVENQAKFVLALTQVSLGSAFSLALPHELEDQEALHKQ